MTQTKTDTDDEYCQTTPIYKQVITDPYALRAITQLETENTIIRAIHHAQIDINTEEWERHRRQENILCGYALCVSLFALLLIMF